MRAKTQRKGADTKQGTTSITFLCSDINEYSRLSREHDVEQVKEWLEQVFTIASHAIEQFQGEILQFTGDGLLASFRGHNHGLMACFAAYTLQYNLLATHLPCHVRVGLYTASISNSEKENLLNNPNIKLTQYIEACSPIDKVQLSAEIYEEYASFLIIEKSKKNKSAEEPQSLISHTLKKLTVKGKEALDNFENKQRLSAQSNRQKDLSQEMHGERKTVTSLFLKLYQAKADTIEDENVADAIKETIRKFDGTLIKNIGDTIFAIFGAPVFYEDHTLRACLTAYMLQQYLFNYSLPLKLYAGIHCGEAVIDVMGSKKYNQYDAVGESVNLAARMMQTAMHNEIQLTEVATHLIDKYVQTKSLDKKFVKGYEEAIPTYALVGINQEAIRRKIDKEFYEGTYFIGRKNEIALFKSFLENLSQQGDTLAFKAEPGMGKSRLVYECKRLAIEEDAIVFSTACLTYEQKDSFATVRYFLHNIFQVPVIQLTDIQIQTIQNEMSKINFQEKLAIPALLTMLGAKVNNPYWTGLSTVVQKKILCQSILDVLIFYSKVHKLVIVFEDLHWCDPDSLAIIEFLIHKAKSIHALFLLDYRSEFDLLNSCKDIITELSLLPLSEENSHELLNMLLPTTENLEEISNMILEISCGNPFFIEEYVKTLFAQNTFVKTEKGYGLSKDFSLSQLPQTISGLIISRIDRLSPTDKKLLQQASILGQSFPLFLLRYLSKLNNEEFSKALSSLEQNGFIHQTNLYPEREYSFRHAHICDATYNTLLRKTKQEYDLRLITKIETSKAKNLSSFYTILSYHAFSAGLWEKAVDYYNKMVPNQHSIDFPVSQGVIVGENAKICFDSMNEEERARSFNSYSRIMLLFIHDLFITQQRDASIKIIEELTHWAKQYKNIGIECLAQGWIVINRSMMGKALVAHEVAKKMYSNLDSVVVQAEKDNLSTADVRMSLYFMIMHAYWPLGDYDKFYSLAEKITSSQLPFSYVNYYTGIPVVSVTYMHLSRCYAECAQFSKFKDKYPLVEEALSSMPISEKFVAAGISLYCFDFGLGHFEECKTRAYQHKLAAEEVQHGLFLLMSTAYYYQCCYYLGEWDGLLLKIRKCLEKYKSVNYAFSPGAAAHLAEVISLMGESTFALEAINDLIKNAEENKRKPLLAQCYRIQAALYNQLHTHTNTIIPLLKLSEKITHEIGCNFQLPFICFTYADYYTHEKDFKKADAYLQKGMDYLETYGMSGWLEYYRNRYADRF